MKLISWNVNGLRACLGKGFQDYFDQTGADAFCIQETKMMQGQAEFAPEGYAQYWNSADKKGYSGTAVFTRMHPLNVTYGMGVDEHDHEGRVITLEFPKFYLVTVYTPNSQRELTRLAYRMTLGGCVRRLSGQAGRTEARGGLRRYERGPQGDRPEEPQNQRA